mmetsp:Transcript_25489/g.57916  ORF Transcript_25489/g.57916 Transcript_25489/m.57916 type:complete len:609 (-) Transcript_25489:38-1864(-)
MWQAGRLDRAASSSIAIGSVVLSTPERIAGGSGGGSLFGTGAGADGSILRGSALLHGSVGPPHIGVASTTSFAEAFRASVLRPAPGAPEGSLDRKAVWGLYCMYAVVGIIYGFVSNYISIPICQYVFGPLGAPGRTSLQQCNISTSVTQMPWNFKVFYGVLLDRVGLFGTRRKGWIIFGWTSALLVLGAMSLVAHDLADEGNFAVYMLLLMVMCSLYIFADVAGDGMTIELSKLEPPEARGYILTTGQMVRFASTALTNVLGILAMNGPSYYPTGQDRVANDTVFSFELQFWQIHVALIIMALPFWIAMVLLLKDPPQLADSQHLHMKDSLALMWQVMKTKVMLFLIVFALGNMAMASLLNPAANVIAYIAGPSTLQNSLGTLLGNAWFLLGVWIFRRYFMHRNWRVTFIWTTILLALNGGFQLLVIYNAWGVGQDGWFFAFGNNSLMVIQGIAQVLSSLAVVEISPYGLEASVYEFLTTMHNAGITLNTNIQNLFVPVFSLGAIATSYFPTPEDPNPPVHDENRRMAMATYFTVTSNLVGAMIFCWFLPKNRRQCKAWADDASWHRPLAGVVSVTLGGSALLFSLVVSFLSAFPATNCLQIAGGSGC